MGDGPASLRSLKAESCLLQEDIPVSGRYPEPDEALDLAGNPADTRRLAEKLNND